MAYPDYVIQELQRRIAQLEATVYQPQENTPMSQLNLGSDSHGADQSPKEEDGNDVDTATLQRWSNRAKQWALEAKARRTAIQGRHLPPGFDPDDNYKYSFRVPK